VRKLSSGGGWQALRYSLKYGKESGYAQFWRAINSKNACKTCALGMGGQQGGMRNEAGHWPEVCKKSLQAAASDMRGKIDPSFWETYSIAQLQAMSPRDLEMMGRIVDPVYAGPGDTHYRVITWEETTSRLAEAMRTAAPEKSFFYASGRSSNEAAFVLQLFARVFGTNHVNNCSYYCHQASGEGLKDSLGTGTATISLDDLEHCDLLFVIGGNPASNHPRLMTSMHLLRQRGGKVIVINPVKELGMVNFKVPSRPMSMLFGTEIASTYVQLKIGGDIAVMVGIAKALLAAGAIDPAYIETATEDWEATRAYLETVSWEEIVAASGSSRELLESIAADYAASENAVFSWTMGITHHEHGVQNVQWIVNLALMRGMVGKPHAGLMPIRGHSNVQGMGSIGVSPAVSKAAVEGLESLGVKVPTFKGYDTLAMLDAAHRGEMSFGFCLGGNLFGASPDARWTGEAISRLGTIAYLNTTLNTGHAHGLAKHTLILPVRARDEEAQSTTQESMFNFVRLSDGGPARWEGPRGEVEIIAELAERVLGNSVLDWAKLQSHDEIRKLIARLVPNLAQLETIGQTKEEFTIPGRVLHTPKFNTPSGKAAFKAHAIPALPPLGPRELRVMTIRSEGQFNTVVYEEEDIYRQQERRDVIVMNERDVERMGLKVDQRVDVSNETGCVPNVLVRVFDIAEGCAFMYFPEANALAPRKADPRSKTPAFKNIVAKVVPA
jgi:molybdopterin-dependent oxidoreductase alpha subunit